MVFIAALIASNEEILLPFEHASCPKRRAATVSCLYLQNQDSAIAQTYPQYTFKAPFV